MILNYQLYILQDYIGQSVEDSAATISTMSLVLMVVSPDFRAFRRSDFRQNRSP